MAEGTHRRVLAALLTNLLRRLVQPGQIDYHAFDAQLQSGTLRLTRLVLRSEPFARFFFGFPVRFHHGSLDSVTVRIIDQANSNPALSVVFKALHLTFHVDSGTPIPSSPPHPTRHLDLHVDELDENFDFTSIPSILTFFRLTRHLFSSFTLDIADIAITLIHSGNVKLDSSFSLSFRRESPDDAKENETRKRTYDLSISNIKFYSSDLSPSQHQHNRRSLLLSLPSPLTGQINLSLQSSPLQISLSSQSPLACILQAWQIRAFLVLARYFQSNISMPIVGNEEAMPTTSNLFALLTLALPLSLRCTLPGAILLLLPSKMLNETLLDSFFTTPMKIQRLEQYGYMRILLDALEVGVSVERTCVKYFSTRGELFVHDLSAFYVPAASRNEQQQECIPVIIMDPVISPHSSPTTGTKRQQLRRLSIIDWTKSTNHDQKTISEAATHPRALTLTFLFKSSTGPRRKQRNFFLENLRIAFHTPVHVFVDLERWLVDRDVVGFVDEVLGGSETVTVGTNMKKVKPSIYITFSFLRVQLRCSTSHSNIDLLHEGSGTVVVDLHDFHFTNTTTNTPSSLVLAAPEQDGDSLPVHFGAHKLDIGYSYEGEEVALVFTSTDPLRIGSGAFLENSSSAPPPPPPNPLECPPPSSSSSSLPTGIHLTTFLSSSLLTNLRPSPTPSTATVITEIRASALNTEIPEAILEGLVVWIYEFTRVLKESKRSRNEGSSDSDGDGDEGGSPLEEVEVEEEKSGDTDEDADSIGVVESRYSNSLTDRLQAGVDTLSPLDIPEEDDDHSPVKISLADLYLKIALPVSRDRVVTLLQKLI